jgi:MinD-like ATPase involved in chromosome partitioning or flagellar assembly
MTHLHPLFIPTAEKPTTPSSVLITTPQTTALNDTVKSLSFTKKLSLPVLGLVENMSGYACPCCGDISDCFGRGGGEDMATRNNIDFLGRVPIDTVLVGLLDAVSKGEIQGAAISDEAEVKVDEGSSFPLLDRYMDTTSSKVWKEITDKIVGGVEKRRTDIASSLSSLSI